MSVLPALWVTALSACDPTAYLTLSFEPGLDSEGVVFDTSSIQALTVVVDDGASAIDPIDMRVAKDEQIQYEPIPLAAVRPVGVDVWGCEATGDCTPERRSFRGCTFGLVELEAGIHVGLRILLFPVDDPRLQECITGPP